MTRTRSQGLGAVVAAAGTVWALGGCQVILGLSSETNLPDASPDASHDVAREASEPGGAAVAVSSSQGASDWCAVTAAGDVWCWGENESGELGDGTTKGRTQPVKVKGLPGPVAAVSVGIGTACALTKAGAVYAWGYGADGELGNGTKNAMSTTAVAVHGLTRGVVSISCGYAVQCAVKDGAVFCWGAGGLGQLGSSQTRDAVLPIPVPALSSDVTQVSVGVESACAVKSGGVYCWGGFDGAGELGNGTLAGSVDPVAVHGLSSGVSRVSVGADFACALTSAGGVSCWGDGTAGQLGNGQFASNAESVQVSGLEKDVVAISAGADSVSAIKRDGSVVTWGYAGDGELGNGSMEADSGVSEGAGGGSPVPVAVKDLGGTAVDVSTGEAPCAALSDGQVKCWGIIAENAPEPIPVSDLHNATSVTAGGYLSTGQFGCAIADGAVWCWGGNDHGQLGNGTTTSTTTPVQNAVLVINATAVAAATAGAFACGIGSGIAYCWGDNGKGQLGNGAKSTMSSTPVAVAPLPGQATAIAAGSESACAIVTSGDAGATTELYCWGDNTFGQLGDGTTTSSAKPVHVTGLSSSPRRISLGIYSACAALMDGTAACWGNNEDGQLGDGTKTTRLVPTKVSGLTGVGHIATGWYSSCAVTGGSISCWGNNSFGQLGDGTTTASLTPVAAQSIFGGVSQVAVGVSSACALAGGVPFCWGLGPIGNGASPGLHFLAPEPVAGSLVVSATGVAVAEGFACDVGEGRVACWGVNTSGELGNGGAVDAFVPVSVAGFP